MKTHQAMSVRQSQRQQTAHPRETSDPPQCIVFMARLYQKAELFKIIVLLTNNASK